MQLSLRLLMLLLMKILLIGFIIVTSALSLLGSFFCGGFDQNLLYMRSILNDYNAQSLYNS